MTVERKLLGASGEDAACTYLRSQGYRILEKNFRNALGEVDIIAQDRDTICFVEVKTRKNDGFGSPLEAVTRKKMLKLRQVALGYLKSRQISDAKARFDVVAIVEDPPSVQLVRNAFGTDELGF